MIASLAEPLYTRLRGQVDILLFNPPYVPTEKEEAGMAQNDADIRGSWAGGEDGMAITNLLLDRVEELLSQRGYFYLVALKQNNIAEIQQRMERNYHLACSAVLQRRAGREHLFILRFCRTTS